MKKNWLKIILGFSYFTMSAQTNSIPLPERINEEHIIYKYDTILQTKILTYEYTNRWDIDRDAHKDIIAFTSNGGAHAYYNLRIWLSSKNKWTTFPTFYIDFPHPSIIENLEELTGPYPQFVVQDFNNDHIQEIYLNLNNPFASIPLKLIKEGVTSKQILIAYKNGNLKVTNFRKKNTVSTPH